MQSATYGTGEVPEVALLREMTGGFLSKGEKKQDIAYEPRAPLVMPPSGTSLPPPAPTAQSADPNWPVEQSQVASLAPGDETPQEQYRRLRPLTESMPRYTNYQPRQYQR